jgi:hypothetical protein
MSTIKTSNSSLAHVLNYGLDVFEVSMVVMEPLCSSFHLSSFTWAFLYAYDEMIGTCKMLMWMTFNLWGTGHILKIMLFFTLFSLMSLNLVIHPCPMQLSSTKDDFDGWAGWITRFHAIDDLQFVQFSLLPVGGSKKSDEIPEHKSARIWKRHECSGLKCNSWKRRQRISKSLLAPQKLWIPLQVPSRHLL